MLAVRRESTKSSRRSFADRRRPADDRRRSGADQWTIGGRSVDEFARDELRRALVAWCVEYLPGGAALDAGAVEQYGRAVGDPAVGLRLLSQQISAEALTMTYNDIFWIMGMGTFCVLPLVLFLRPLPKGAKPATVH